MAIDNDDAASALSDVARIEQRTRELVRYSFASNYQLLWGVLVVIGYLVQWAHPESGAIIWAVVVAAGILGGVAFRIWRARQAGRPADFRWVWGQLAVVVFGMVWTGLLTNAVPRQLVALWPTFFMFWMVIFGIFFGRFFVILGLLVTALTVVGYLWSGGYFLPWMAAVAGGGLIASGLYLRRIGVNRR
jgi:hypothetical protein